MKTLHMIIISFISLLSLSTLAKDAEHGLDFASISDFFAGDHLDSWEDPKDDRFKGMDLKAFFKANTAIREELFNLRQKYIKKYYELVAQPNADFVQLGKEMTEATREWVAKYLKKSLPSSIHESEMAFISFGSMARGESGPITDLEGAIVWDKNIPGQDALSMVFAQNLANILDPLLGHPIYGVKGFRLDEAQNSPFHKGPFAKNFSAAEAYCWAARSLPNIDDEELAKFKKSYFYPFEGSWAYATTPRTLAEYTRAATLKWPFGFEVSVTDEVINTPWYQWSKQFLTPTLLQENHIAAVLNGSSCMKNKNQNEIRLYAKNIAERMEAIEIGVIKQFPLLGRNHILVYGNEKLFKEFKDRRNEILDQNNGRLRKRIVNEIFHSLVRKHGNEITIDGTLPDVVDLKRHFYRFEEQLYTTLMTLYKLEVQNQTDIIKEFMDMGVFGAKYGARALARQNNLTKMRWREMILLESQLDPKMNFISKAAFDKKIKEINEEMATNEAIINNKASKAVDRLVAKAALIELKQDLKKMPNLDPTATNAIFTKQDIDYLKNTLIPEQAESFRRMVAFTGSKNIAPIKTAFSDDFDWKKIDLKKYGIKQKK